jgi:hypothetical protein
LKEASLELALTEDEKDGIIRRIGRYATHQQIAMSIVSQLSSLVMLSQNVKTRTWISKAIRNYGSAENLNRDLDDNSNEVWTLDKLDSNRLLKVGSIET